MNILVNQKMSLHPETTMHDESLSVAYQRMIRGDYRHLPVLDHEANLVGIISDRDFQRAMWPISNLIADQLVEGPRFQKDAKVYEFMSWPVKTLPHTSELISAISLMIDEKISAVIITKKEEILGIITHEDLLKILATLLMKPEAVNGKAMALTHSSPLHKVSEFLAGWNLDTYLV